MDRARLAEEAAAADSARAASESAQAAALTEEYNERLEELENTRSEFEEEMELERARLYGANERTARNVAAMNAFEKGRSLRMYLRSDEDGWFIEIYSGDEQLADIHKGTDISAGIDNTLQNAGFAADDVLLAEFIYDSDMPGSKSGYDSVVRAAEQLRTKYNYLYISKTDVKRIKND